MNFLTSSGWQASSVILCFLKILRGVGEKVFERSGFPGQGSELSTSQCRSTKFWAERQWSVIGCTGSVRQHATELIGAAILSLDRSCDPDQSADPADVDNGEERPGQQDRHVSCCRCDEDEEQVDPIAMATTMATNKTRLMMVFIFIS